MDFHAADLARTIHRERQNQPANMRCALTVIVVYVVVTGAFLLWWAKGRGV